MVVTGDDGESSGSVVANDVVVVVVSFVREAWAHRTTGCQGEEGSSEMTVGRPRRAGRRKAGKIDDKTVDG